MSENTKQALIIYGFLGVVGFFIVIYLIRAIFNIPTMVRLQRAQVRLLEEMAKKQGVEEEKVKTIIAETNWESLA